MSPATGTSDSFLAQFGGFRGTNARIYERQPRKGECRNKSQTTHLNSNRTRCSTLPNDQRDAGPNEEERTQVALPCCLPAVRDRPAADGKRGLSTDRVAETGRQCKGARTNGSRLWKGKSGRGYEPQRGRIQRWVARVPGRTGPRWADVRDIDMASCHHRIHPPLLLNRQSID